MRIDQRNVGASVTPAASAYTIDRWLAYVTQASKYSVQQNAGSVTPPAGFVNYFGVTSTSAYSVVASDTFIISQNIEGFNGSDFDWGKETAKTITLSFWVRSSLTGTFGGSLGNSTGTRSYLFDYTINSANTWEYKSITIAGDTSGTWNTDNSAFVVVRFGLGSGSTFLGTAGSWTAGNIVQPTGSVSVVGTNGATFYITGVQFEAGSTATDFERRPIGTELALCERYFEQTYFVSLGSGFSTSYPQATYRVQKRATPTLTFSMAGGSFTPSTSSLGFYQNSQNTNNVPFALVVYSSIEL